MEFKCKKCGNEKYKQINTSIKQCLSCGKEILSSGQKSNELDWTSEIEEKNSPSIEEMDYQTIDYKTLLKQIEDLTFNRRMGVRFI